MRKVAFLCVVGCLLSLTMPAQTANVINDPNLSITRFVAGGIQGSKFSVIDSVGGAYGGLQFVAELGGGKVMQVPTTTPPGGLGPVVPVAYTGMIGPDGLAGIDIDAATADQPAATAGLYGGKMYVATVSGGAGGPIWQVQPGGAFVQYTVPAPGSNPGTAGLHFDRTPGFAYGGFMYAADWGGDATDQIFKVSPGGAVTAFAALPNLDPRYFAFDWTGGYGGQMWVSSCNTGQILPVSPAGVAGAPLTTLAAGVEGIAFGLGDQWFGSSMYVGNVSTGEIYRVDPNGTKFLLADLDTGAAYLQFVPAGNPYAINNLPTMYVDDGGSGVWAIYVPEPATISLLALGGMAMLRRRGRG